MPRRHEARKAPVGVPVRKVAQRHVRTAQIRKSTAGARVPFLTRRPLPISGRPRADSLRSPPARPAGRPRPWRRCDSRRHDNAKAFQVGGQRTAEAPRIFGGRDAGAQIGQYQALRPGPELTQLARRIRVERDAPGPAAHRLGVPLPPRGLRGERSPAPVRRRRQADAAPNGSPPDRRHAAECLAHVKAFGAAGLLSERRKAFLDVERQTNGKHSATP